MNARITCLLLGLLLVAGAAQAQPEVEWEKAFGGRVYDEFTDVVQTSDGGFAMAGTFLLPGPGYNSFWLIRTNAIGDSLWSRTFGNEDNEGYNYSCNSLIQTADGGFAMAGSTSNVEGFSDGHFWLIRTDANGDSLWTRNYGRFSEKCYSLVQTADGGFALAGYTVLTDVHDQRAFWLLRTDGDGDSLWAHSYSSRFGANCRSLVQTSDGGFAMAGATWSSERDSSDYFLVRTNSDGDSLWSRTFDKVTLDECTSLIQTADGGFALTGPTSTHGNQNEDFWLVKTDSDGDSLWSRSYGHGERNWCYALVETPDRGFAMAGLNSFLDIYSGFWVIRTNADGDSLWSSYISEHLGLCNSIINTSDGGFALAGYECSDNDGDHYGYIIKTTPDPVSVREPRSTLNPLTFNLYPAYPNPFNSMVTIPFGLDKSAPTRLAIFDPLGRRVAELTPNGGLVNGPYAGGGATGLVNGPYAAGRQTVFWDASGFPAGSYLVRLEAGNEQLTQRLSLVK